MAGLAERVWRLPGWEKGILLRAWLWLPVVDCGLRLLGYDRLSRLLERRLPQRESGEASSKLERISRLVDAAAEHSLYPMSCVRRALVLRRLLAGLGVASRLRFGVRRQGEELAAHAWVEVSGQPLGERRGLEGYRRLGDGPL